jgi:hypothetical protein
MFGACPRSWQGFGACPHQQLAYDTLRLARTSSQLRQVEFPALVMLVRTHVALQQRDVPGAARELEQLEAEWLDEQDKV